MDQLGAAFLAAIEDAGLRASARRIVELPTRLETLVASARAEHPDLVSEGAQLVSDIAQHMPAGTEPEVFLDHLAAADFALACACTRGRPGALEELERRFDREINAVIARFSRLHNPDDLHQALREHLFVGVSGRPPRLASYSGQGFLANWLRVTAVRLFLDLGKRRDRPREAGIDDDEILRIPDPCDDPEMDFLKREYRAAFSTALYAAAGALDPVDRNLLRQHHAGGLGIDELGKIHGVHRATAARRLTRAREALLKGTRAALMDELSIDGAELDSIMTLIASRIDISLQRLFVSEAVG